MITNFVDTFFDLLCQFKTNKKTVLSVVFVFACGVVAGVFLNVKYIAFYGWILNESFFKCLIFSLLIFVISSAICILCISAKRLFIVGLSLVFARGLLFCFALKHVFYSFSVLASLLIFLVFLMLDFAVLYQICQISIYYYKHNISKRCYFDNFLIYLFVCCILFAVVFTLIVFVVLRLFLILV